MRFKYFARSHRCGLNALNTDAISQPRSKISKNADPFRKAEGPSVCLLCSCRYCEGEWLVFVLEVNCLLGEMGSLMLNERMWPLKFFMEDCEAGKMAETNELLKGRRALFWCFECSWVPERETSSYTRFRSQMLSRQIYSHAVL